MCDRLRQLNHARQFLAAHLSRQDRDAMDRLPAVSKYVLGFRISSGKEPFKRDRQPIPTLTLTSWRAASESTFARAARS